MLNKHILKIKEYSNSYQYTYYPILNRHIRKIRNNKCESVRCSSSRSCSLIKDYILNNDFEYFMTLTIKDDLKYDIVSCSTFIISQFHLYSKACKKRNIDFRYIYVFEKTKKGGLHVHAFVNGLFDLYVNKYGYKSSLFFDNIGFQNYQDAKNCNPFYLIKYIIKDPIKELKHRFYCSRNLKKGDVVYIHDNFEEFLNFSFTFQSPFCKMVTVKK